MIDEVQDIIARLWCLKWEVLMSFSPYILVLAAFIAFVIWNGSVVLGTNCLPCLHIQFIYCACEYIPKCADQREKMNLRLCSWLFLDRDETGFLMCKYPMDPTQKNWAWLQDFDLF